jgi:hypothetical protein
VVITVEFAASEVERGVVRSREDGARGRRNLLVQVAVSAERRV